MYLRKLKNDDAINMLEWMHDVDVVENLHSEFLSKKIEDCLCFIKNSMTKNNVNFAISSDTDEYMGTVSLKNIDRINKTAEFAIVVRKSAMGCGYSRFGMQEIIKYAFEKLNLNSIYWCVSKNNKRACRFYEKNHFKELYDVDESILKQYDDTTDLKWFIVNKGDIVFNSIPTLFDGVSLINIKTIGTSGAGQLSFFESTRDVPFNIKRLYYISRVPEGKRRGFHAHKALKQILFCPFGQIIIILDNGEKREEIILNDPSIGLLIDGVIWREMLWIQSDSVLCVAASDYFNPEDYIRDYDEFIHYVKNK